MDLYILLFLVIASLALAKDQFIPVEPALKIQNEITRVIVSHITIVDPQLTRHEQEYARLQDRLDRSSEKWDSNSTHPRYRLLAALVGFKRYKERQMAEVQRWRDLYKHVSKRQKSIIESTIRYTRKLNSVEHLIDKNNQVAQNIVEQGMAFYNISTVELDMFLAEKDREGKLPDRTSVTQAMKHLVRDWGEEGRAERQEAFICVLGELDSMPRSGQEPLRALVPGAGIGRLAHEVNGLGGFEVTMNEWSMYMNLVYRYVMTLSSPHHASFHPYIDWWSHHTSTIDMQRGVSFPDPAVDPYSVLLVEGDFTTVFADDPGEYDVIITLFFIDTARNLLSYLETIHRLLRVGGTWINLGPLLYGSAPFLQLSLDEVIALAEAVGFRFVETDGAACGSTSFAGKSVRGKMVAYGQNAKGLSRNAYQAQSWRAVKV